MQESLSIQQAQKLVLHSQRVLPTNQSGRASEATLSAIEHLGYMATSRYRFYGNTWAIWLLLVTDSMGRPTSRSNGL